jgi:hypothetical protein
MLSAGFNGNWPKISYLNHSGGKDSWSTIHGRSNSIAETVAAGQNKY